MKTGPAPGGGMKLSTAMMLIKNAIGRDDDHRPMRSPHEGFAIVQGRYLILRDEVMQSRGDPSHQRRAAINLVVALVKFLVRAHR